MEQVADLHTWEELQTILASPLPLAEVTHSTDSMSPDTDLLDLTKEGSSTICKKREKSDPMDVVEERKKAKTKPKPNLQLLTYTKGKSVETTTETRSSGPSFSIEYLNMAILGEKDKGKEPASAPSEK